MGGVKRRGCDAKETLTWRNRRRAKREDKDPSIEKEARSLQRERRRRERYGENMTVGGQRKTHISEILGEIRDVPEEVVSERIALR